MLVIAGERVVKTVQMKLPEHISSKLQALGIATLYLFGSRAQGVAHPGSDYDFGLLLSEPARVHGGTQSLYQEVYELLQDLVPATVNMDIVFLDQATLQLRYHVISHGNVLLDTDPLRRGRFEVRTLEEHADFEPYRRMFEEATLARIP